MSLLKVAGTTASSGQLYVDDVFSTYLYDGAGASQTITNGIDLAGKGGMVWIKQRNGASAHNLRDTVRGNNYALNSALTNAQSSGWSTVFNFTSTGYAITGTNDQYNGAGGTYASWTFRKAAKFFDVVTYTGTGGGNRQISHSLGTTVGMIIVKRTDTTRDWNIYQRSISPINQNNMQLNTTSATSDGGQDQWGNGITVIVPTSTQFTVGVSNNASGGTYVAYLFAHDTSSTGIIQCGSFTTDGSGNATVNLGWEPQYLMVKNASTDSNWYIVDSMRGFTTEGSVDNYLYANNSLVEDSSSIFSPTATGFKIAGWWSSATVIYMAIRRPNKPPTTGTQVYNAVENTASGAISNNGFPVDLSILTNRAGNSRYFYDRMRGNVYLTSETANAEVSTSTYLKLDNMIGVNNVGWLSSPNIFYGFKRAPGFMDVVCYTGTGVATTQAHNLTVAPELMIVKTRSAVGEWCVYSSTLGNTKSLFLSSTQGADIANAYWNSTTPTSSVFSIGTFNATNSYTYVAYLFATLAGISKVGSYTGNGTGQAIACGFSVGARFVLIKRTDSNGDWYTFDSARGLTSTSSPYSLLNSTAAETTGNNGVYASTGGFTLGSTASTTTNISGASYIFLSVA